MTRSPIATIISPKRILVVDDDLAVADSIRMVLKFAGHKVEITEDPRKVARILSEEKYDLVITDFAMGTMTGLDLAREIKARTPAMPVVLITAYAESLGESKERLSNIDCLIGKPFSLEQMSDALRTVFPAENQ